MLFIYFQKNIFSCEKEKVLVLAIKFIYLINISLTVFLDLLPMVWLILYPLSTTLEHQIYWPHMPGPLTSSFSQMLSLLVLFMEKDIDVLPLQVRGHIPKHEKTLELKAQGLSFKLPQTLINSLIL